MNRFLNLSAAIIIATGAWADNAPLTFSSLDVDRGRMNVVIGLDLKSLNVKSNESATLTPVVITSSNDSIALDPLTVYGRKQLLHAERLREKLPAGYLRSGQTDSTTYSASLPYSPALNGSHLAVKVETFGCASCHKSTRWVDGSSWTMPEIIPADHIVYEVPQVTVTKETAISGRAFVEFPVNKTTLLTDFRTNAAELSKITATIDSVKNDPDITLTTIFIKGFASPEGSYANNRRLAEGRTEALKQWVERLYSFPSDFIATAYEPEDWDGLRAAVEADATLPHRAGLLEIINDLSLEPDARDARLRQAYPDAYARLLAEIYPALRHSDYRVEYTIRSFSSPEEILAIMKQNPRKLSPDEFFAAARSLDPESDEYRHVLQTAADIHPDSKAANLNAASVAIKSGNLDDAERYLARAGNSPQAMYTRGLLAIARNDYATASLMLNQASKAGYAKADELLPKVNELKKLH